MSPFDRCLGILFEPTQRDGYACNYTASVVRAGQTSDFAELRSCLKAGTPSDEN